jgi:hypothetical protein
MLILTVWLETYESNEILHPLLPIVKPSRSIDAKVLHAQKLIFDSLMAIRVNGVLFAELVGFPL